MKRTLATIALFCFAGFAIFGALGMQMEMEGHGGCIAAALSGEDCATQNTLFGHFAMHSEAAKIFSTAVFGKHPAAIFTALFFFVMGALAIFVAPFLHIGRFRFVPALRKRERALAPPALTERMRWHSLHENSPGDALERR